MGFTYSRIALHFSMPMGAEDWRNLERSRVRLVQLPWAQALHRPGGEGKPTQLDLLTGAGYGVILRMDRGDYVTRSDGQLRNDLGLRLAETHGRGLEACIVGNEPDIGVNGQVDLRLGSKTWEQESAYRHAYETRCVRDSIGDRVRLVGAPLSNRYLTEDAAPEPGLLEWWAPLKAAYHNEGLAPTEKKRMAGVGVHIYEHEFYGLAWDVNTWRAKGKLWLWKTLWQAPVWIDEWNVAKKSLTDVERMRAFGEFAKMIKGRAGIELLSPFVSNGDYGDPSNPKWPPQYLMRDPAAYEELGRLVAGG